MKPTKRSPKKLAESLGSKAIDINQETNGLLVVLQERLGELEMARENLGWERLGRDTQWDFTRDFLRRMIGFARLMYIKNPLIHRAVEVQTLYVWAMGFSITHENDDVKRTITAYMNDPKNKKFLFSQEALMDMENTQQVTGNIFLIHFINRLNGVVRTRRVDVEEILDIVYNPDDRNEPWLYLRGIPSATGQVTKVYCPDVNWLPLNPGVPAGVIMEGGVPIEWDTPIHHHKTGGFGTMKFGVPEVYAALDWATAYKNFLEDWCTLMKAYSRIAMQMSGIANNKLGAAKSKMEVGVAGASGNGATAAGFMVNSGPVELKAVKTAGATTSAEEGYSVKLMVASAMGLPGTFFGDADVGNFATSQTLDRPTELKMVARQGLWKQYISDVIGFVITQSVIAPQGELALAGFTYEVIIDEVEQSKYYKVIPPKGLEPKDGEEEDEFLTDVLVSFPNILERDVADRIRGIVGALTLGGNQPTDVLPDRLFMAKMIIQALGLPPDEVSEVLEKMYPPGTEVPPIPVPTFGGGMGMGPDGKPLEPKGGGSGRPGPAGGGAK